MTSTAALTRSLTRPARPATFTGSTLEITRRALLKYFRSPGIFVMGIVQSTLFLFMFRYVFGGAIHAGNTAYVEYLMPGFVATIVLFNGGAVAVGVAEDKAQGLTDRLLSLPISRLALVVGRVLADFTTTAWWILFTTGLGFAYGFRLHSSAAHALAALGLCLLYGLVFTLVFIVIGLYSPNAQGAQGLAMIGFVLAFISSTYVPPASMPGWLQPFVNHQPVTPMVNSVRSVLLGGSHDLATALIWSVALILVFTPVAVLRYRHA
jgi:ABC-2 type transport system permease protein